MSFRPIHPAHPPASELSKSHSSQHGDRKGPPPPGRRTRNTPKDVTANACVQCKKARTKCDGKQPCFRCYQRNEGAICEYRVHVKMAKEEILERFNLLAEQYRWAHRIMKALISDNHAPGIVERLKRGEDYGSVARSFVDTPLANLEPAPSSRDQPDPGGGDSMDYEVEGMAESVSKAHFLQDEFAWTRVTPDLDLVNHLLELYFTWVHPIHMVLSEPHFKISYASHDGVYCSAALVNVICAMACHLFEPPPDDEIDYDTVGYDGLGDRFMDEGRSLVKPEDHNKLTTIQTFAIMFLADAGSGKALKASSYIRFASTTLVDSAVQHNVHRDAWQITVWGVHSLNVCVAHIIDPFTHDQADGRSAWAEFTYDLSHSPQLLNANVLDGVRLDREDGQWRPYRQMEDVKLPAQPNFSLLTTFESAKFLQIVQDINTLFYDIQTNQISARDVVMQHRKLVLWKDELPEIIGKLDLNERQLPHVLFLHIHYHTAVVGLFRPLVGFNQLSRGSPHSPEGTALQSAQKGFQLLDQYRSLYTFRYQPQLQILCVIHICDFLVRFGPPHVARSAARFCLDALKESRSGFGVCGPLQEMFRRTLVECGIPMPEDLAELMSGNSEFCLDEMMDACTRLSYTQPVEQVRRHMSSTIAEEWEKEAWKMETSSPGSSTSSGKRRDDNEKLMQIRSILNR